MRRLLRAARVLAVAVVVVLALAAAAVWALLGTEAGSAWVLREGAQRAGVALGFERLTGRWLGRVEIAALDVDVDGTRVQVDRLVLDWRPAALLEARVHLRELAAHGVLVRVPPAPPADGPPRIEVPALPQIALPVAVDVDRLEITALRLDDAAAPAALDRLALALTLEDGTLTVRELALDRGALALTGTLAVDMEQDWPLRGALALKGREADQPVDLDLAIAGAARAPQLQLTLRAPLAATGELRSDLRQHPPTAALELQWTDVALEAAAPLTSPEGRLSLAVAPAGTQTGTPAGAQTGAQTGTPAGAQTSTPSGAQTAAPPGAPAASTAAARPVAPEDPQSPAPPDTPLAAAGRPADDDAAAPPATAGGAGAADALGFRLSLDTALDGAPSGVRRVVLDANGTLGALAAPFPMATAFTWTVAAQPATFSGGGTVSGDLTRLAIDHALDAPFHVATTGDVAPAGVDTRLSLRGDWRELRWPPDASAGPASPSGTYSVEGALDGLTATVAAALSGVEGVDDVAVTVAGSAAAQPPHTFDVRIDWRAGTTLAGELRGAGTAKGDTEKLRFEHRLSGPATLDVGGDVTLSPALALDVSGSWQDLRWPLEGETVAASPQGRFSAKGGLDALVTRVDAKATAEPVGELDLRAAATVSQTRARDIDLQVDLLGGSVTARGEAGWDGPPEVKLVLTAADLDPGRIEPRATGRIGARISTDLRLEADGPRGSVALESLAGELGGYPVSGEGRVLLAGDRFEVDAVSLRTGDNRLDVSGTVAQSLSLDYRLDAPDLGQLWPDLEGTVRGQGQVRGAAGAPAVKASLEASNLAAGDARVARLSLDADVDLSRDVRSVVRARATDIAAGGQAIATASVDLEGTPSRHALRVDVDASEGRVALAAAGGLDGDTWSGELRTLDALATPLGDWRLERPAAVTAGAQGITAGDTCLASDGARLCVRAARDGGQSAEARLSSLPVNRFSPWLPPGLEVTGALDASVAARQDRGGPWQADATLTATPTRFRLAPEDGGEPLELALDDTRVEARHDAAGTTASLSSRIAGDGTLRGDVRLGPAGAPSVPLSGRIDAALPDLAPFKALVPALTDLTGRLQAGLDLSGTLERPGVEGTVALTEAGATVAPAGITLERTALTLRGNADGSFSLDGTVHSGPGSLAVDGRGTVDGDGFQAKLGVRGENFEAVKLIPVQALVSPDLTVDAGPERIAVRGKVHVPEATVTIDEVPPDVVQVSDDETIVGAEPKPPAPGREKLDVKVALTLGDKVQVSAFGLETGLAGGLDVAVEGARPPTARGTVTLVGGRFNAYGQDLRIRRGRLLFAGPLDNPGLDFRAVRDAGEVVAGIEVSGSAANMRSRIFSDPSLPEAEALSWLLTGRGLADGSSADGSALASAAVSLGLERSDQITRQIGSALGLDELSVDTGGGLNESALVLGKALSPRLYLRYALGVLDREGSVFLNYKLTDTISVEAESGSSQGGDVLYRLER